MNPLKANNWLSVSDISRRLGMSESWVRTMIVSGRLRAVAYETGARRTYRIREAWLAAFLREYRVGPDEIGRP